jgi:hypothetical protein
MVRIIVTPPSCMKKQQYQEGFIEVNETNTYIENRSIWILTSLKHLPHVYISDEKGVIPPL